MKIVGRFLYASAELFLKVFLLVVGVSSLIASSIVLASNNIIDGITLMVVSATALTMSLIWMALGSK